MRVGQTAGIWAAWLVAGCAAVAQGGERVGPLANAHAHNDYLHPRPLLDALDQGFTSVEADIFLVDGQLLVAHTRRELKPDRTLTALYLEPLRQRIKARGGSVHGDGAPFHLLVDIKSDGESTYRALHELLAGYADVVTAVRDGQIEPRAVRVAVSGDRPTDTMAGQKLRYAGFDGRWGDLESDLPTHLMPLVSDNWRSYFKWRGRGEIDPAERDKLVAAVKAAHARGRRIRFWATPETVETWRELHRAGVDMINTDNLAGLAEFLRATSDGPAAAGNPTEKPTSGAR